MPEVRTAFPASERDNAAKRNREAGITIHDLTMRFAGASGEIQALDHVNLTIKENEFLCIVGPSGCGKTTLLRILAGLEVQTSGSVRFVIDATQRPLQSMVFQEQGIFPWFTVLDNAAYGLAVRRIPKKKRYAHARECLRKLDLSAFERAYPHELSGGMLQRVNLARAFVNDPAVLLMDEPLGALDEQTKMLVQADLLKLWESARKTVLFITHSLDEAIVLGDRVAVMSKRPGVFKTIVPIDLKRPRDALELRNDRRFMSLRRTLWEALRSEVSRDETRRP